MCGIIGCVNDDLVAPVLLQGLKHAAVEERTDVSALLCRLAEDYLKERKGVRR